MHRSCTVAVLFWQLFRQVRVADPLLDPAPGAVVPYRSYLLHLPRDYDPARPYPLVLDYHGYYFTALLDDVLTGWSAVANDPAFGPFIVVYPQGMSDTAEVGDDGRERRARISRTA